MRLGSRNRFGDLLREKGLNGIGIEIGVATGNFSQILLEHTSLQKIYFLDAWKHFSPEEYKDPCNASQKEQDKRHASVIKRLAPYGDRYEIIKGDCTEIVNNFEDGYFDFLYIDANHEYQYIKRDLKNWYPKVKSGGIFAGHDYLTSTNSKKICGVKKAVDEFCSEHNLEVFITGGTRRIPPSWFLIRG